MAKAQTRKLDTSRTVELPYRGRTHRFFLPAGEWEVIEDDKTKPPVDGYRFKIHKSAADKVFKQESKDEK